MRRSIQRFEIRTQLGEGGMGTVYRAHDPQLERDVAIKVLRGAAEEARAELSTVNTVDLRGGSAASTLLREARMMARLSHPNVVPVYEVGLDGDAVFVVMEHVDGLDLRAWLAAERRSPEEVLRVFAHAAGGLAAAHARGIVHRDFKPDNVLIGADGRARVADFGVSQLAAPGEQLVRGPDTVGTPRYMAPELWDGAQATPASDVYAFCVALLEMLGDDRDRMPPRLRRLVDAGLAETPAERPDIGQLAEAFGARRGPRVIAIIAACTVAAAAVAIVLAIRARAGGAAPTCGDDPSLFATRWNDAAKAALRARYTGAGDARFDRLFAAVDARVAQIATAHRTACERVQTGEITEAQGEIRRGCIERRAMELGARARHYATATPAVSIDLAEEYISEVWQHEWCDVVTAPALPDDAAQRARIEALHARHWPAWALPHADSL
ncbi:MAG: serine/threonine protein kinase, partial [Deltaproteobacteria bacterium]|nr:serine/threonine protein kinase [Deltaproteobacteria bacterium]